MTNSGVDFTYLFNQPVGVEPAAPFIDIPGIAYTLAQFNNDYSKRSVRSEGRLVSHTASALEHQVWEELIGSEFISTVKGIQLVRERYPAQPVQHDDSQLDDFLFDRVSTETRDTIQEISGTANAYVVMPIAAVVAQGNPTEVYFSETVSGSSIIYTMAITHNGETLGGAIDGWAPKSTYSIYQPQAGWALLDWNSGFGDWGSSAGLEGQGSTHLTNNSGGDPVSMISGNLHHMESDLRIPADGPDFELTRSYNSRVEEAGALGVGWTHSYDLRVEPAKEKQEFVYLPTSLESFFLQDQLEGARSDTLETPSEDTPSSGNATVHWASLPATFVSQAEIESITLEVAFSGEFDLIFSTGQPNEPLSGEGFASFELVNVDGTPFVDLSTPLSLTLEQFFNLDELRYARLRIRYRGPPVKRVELQPDTYSDWVSASALQDADPSTCTLPDGDQGSVTFVEQAPGGVFGYELAIALRAKHDYSQPASQLWRGPVGSGEVTAVGPERFTDTGVQMRVMSIGEDPPGFSGFEVHFDPFDDTYPDPGPSAFLCHLQYRILTIPRGVDVVVEDGTRLRFSETEPDVWTPDPGIHDTLTWDGQGYELTRTDGSVLRFDEPRGDAYYLKKISDPQGRSLLLSYDPQTDLLAAVSDDTQVEDAAGQMITPALSFAYTNGYLSSVTDWTGRVWHYTVVGDELVEARDPLDTVGTKYEYGFDADEVNEDLRHNLTKITFPQDSDGIGGGDHWVAFTYFNSDRVASHTDSLGNTQQFLYNVPRLESEVIDPRGFRTIYRYDRQANLVQRVDPDGAIWDWTYDEDRHLTSETDPLGFTRTFDDFADNGLPRSVEDKDTLSESLTFDPTSGQVESRTDKRGNTRGTTFSLGQPVTSYADLGGSQQTLSTHVYDPGSHRLDKTIRQLGDGTGRQEVTLYTYRPGNRDVERIERWEDGDGNGEVTDPADQLLAAVDFEYDDLGRRTKERLWRIDDPDGATQVELVTGYCYNDRDELYRIERPDGTAVVREFDDNGNLTAQYLEVPLPKPDPGGSSTAVHQRVDYEYDALDRLMKATDARDNETRFEYDAMGNRTAAIDPSQAVLQVEYDAMGRPIRTRDRNGSVWLTEYDSLGRVVAQVDPTGVRSTRGHDEIGRLVDVQLGGNESAKRTVIYGTGTPKTYEEHIQDPNGETTILEFDELGRVFRSTDARSGTTQMGYDFAGNVLSLTDPTQAQSTFTFDALGRQVSASYPWATGPKDTAYDETGNPVRATKPDGCQLDMTYDLMGRLLTRTSTGNCDGTVADEYGYDLRGNLVVARNPNAAFIRRYDELDRLVSEIDTRFNSAIHYVYDPSSRLTERVYPDGSVVHISYDLAGQPIGITDPFGDTTRYVYDPAGRRIQTLSSSSQIQTDLTYNADGRLSSLVSRAAGTQVASHDYDSYDEVGNRLSMENDAGVSNYQYDELDRLKMFTPPSGAAIHYAYDAAGNREMSGAQASGQFVDPYVTYAYDAPSGNPTHHLLSAAHSTTGVLEAFAAYDANGNPTAWQHNGEDRTLTWDALDRLVAITGDYAASYTYGPLGRRVQKTEASVTTSYQYDGLDIVAEYSSSSNATYVFGPGVDEPIRIARDGLVGAYHTDGIGSVVVVTDTSAGPTELASYSYDAFGEEQEPPPSFANAYTFTGREQDTSGLYYYRARYYLPTVGRFLTPDPLGVADGANPYLYVGSNPVNFRDPFGLFAQAGGGRTENAAVSDERTAIYAAFGFEAAFGGDSEGALGDFVARTEVTFVNIDVAVLGNTAGISVGLGSSPEDFGLVFGLTPGTGVESNLLGIHGAITTQRTNAPSLASLKGWSSFVQVTGGPRAVPLSGIVRGIIGSGYVGYEFGGSIGPAMAPPVTVGGGREVSAVWSISYPDADRSIRRASTCGAFGC